MESYLIRVCRSISGLVADNSLRYSIAKNAVGILTVLAG